MITATMSSRYEIVVPFRIRDLTGREHDLQAIVDTGFSGSLSLPTPVIISLGLPWKSETVTILADSSVCKSDLFEATILWDKQLRVISVHGMNNVPMIGTKLLRNFELRACFQIGGRVEIEAIP